MKRLCLMLALITLCLISTLTVAMAQPDPKPAVPAPVKAPIQEAIDANTAQMKKMMAMTPAQMQQELLRLHEKSMRMVFTQAGFNDLELQDTLWQWLKEQETARREVRKAAQKVYLGIQPHTAVTDAQMEAAIADYQSFVEDEKVRREAATAELDKKISFSRRPKLRALLMMQGYIGDEAWFTGSSLMASSLTMSSMNMVGDK